MNNSTPAKYMKTCIKIKTHKKHYFQLLEVMIAMLLIVTCVAPALHIYMNMYKIETQSKQNYEADHLARLIFASIIEQLYLNAIPLEEIDAGLDRSVEDPKFESKLKAIGFKAHYTITKLNQQKKKNKPTQCCLTQISIFLQNIHTQQIKQYDYKQYVEVPTPPTDDDTKNAKDALDALDAKIKDNQANPNTNNNNTDDAADDDDDENLADYK